MKRASFGVTGWILAAAIVWWPAGALPAHADWPVFQRDSAHSGVDASGALRAPLQDAWHVSVASEGWTFASAAVADEVVYIGTLQGEVLAQDRRTGRELWRYASDGAIYLTPAVSSGKVVFGSSDGSLVALDTADGRVLWSFRTGSDIHASPVVAGDKVYFASNDGYAYAAELETGVLSWKTLLSGRILASPAIDGGHAYFATQAGRIVALGAADGSVLWDVFMPDHIRSAPSVSQGVLYIGGHDGKLRALDASNGSALWTFDAGAPILNGLAVTSGAVYSASLDGKVRAVDRSGQLIWAFDAGVQIHAAPTIAGTTLVIGAEDKNLYFVDTSSGALLSQTLLSGRVAGPAALSRGRVYVFTDDGVLSSFESPNLPPTAPVSLTLNGRAEPSLNASTFTFNWSFSDPDANDRQSAFSLAIASGAPVFAAPIVASGVRESTETSFALDQALPEGRYFWQVQSYDLFGATSPFSTSTFVVDLTAPQVVIHSPAGGETFTPTVNNIVVSVSVGDNFDPAPAVEAFLVELEDRGVPLSSAPARVAVGTAAVVNPLDIDDGVWRLEVTATDAAGNSTSTVSGSFEVIHDVRPPRTALAVGTPKAEEGGVTTITRATLFNLSSVDDLASAGDGIGQGVALQSVSVDGVLRSTFPNVSPAAGQVFSSSFTLAVDADGLHLLAYHARDTLGNDEAVHVATVAVDNTAPLTSLTSFGGREYVAPAMSDRYVSSDTRFSLLAVDPVIGGAAAGVADTRLKDNGVAFSTAIGTFTLPEGLHSLDFGSEDRVGNRETVKSTTVAVDATEPQTSLMLLGGRQYAGVDAASFYASSETRVVLAAVDPPANGVASGLASIEFGENGGAFQVYVSSLALVEGVHALVYHSRDNVGNLEISRSTNVLVDQTPPVAEAHVGGITFTAMDGTLYISSSSPVTFAAADPMLANSGTAGSGVGRIEISLDGATYTPYSAALTFAEGRHIVFYRAVDNVGNVETERELRLRSDATPPVTAFNPGGALYAGADGAFFAPASYFYSFAATDPVVGDVASDIAFTRYALDGGAFQTYMATFTLAEGVRRVDFRSQDNVGNSELIKSATVFVDATPPATALSITTSVSSGYVSGDTRFVLAAVDPVVNGAASGVKLSRYRVNGGAFVTEPLDFGLSGADGAYTLEYQSEDNIGNLEVLRSTAVILDRTPPVTTVLVGAPSFTAQDGTLYVDPAAPVTLTAADSASGVERIEVSLDGAPFTAYAAALTFAEGRHSVQYRSVDKVGNIETARTLNLRSDSTPPLTTFAPSGTFFTGTGGASFAPPSFSYALPAADPVAGDVGSGLAFTRYALDSGTFQTYTTTFTLAEGIRRVDFRSQDNVGNSELLRSATVFVDATSPETALNVGTPQFAGGGTLYVSTGTPFSLASQDPVVQGVFSGLASISFRVRGNAFSSYVTTFTLQGLDGTREIDWRATDNVGNLESTKTSVFILDQAPPVTTVQVGAPSFTAVDGTLYVDPATPVTLSAVDSAVGAGVERIEVGVDGAAFAPYAAALAFSEGRHTVVYRAVDKVGNIEAVRTLSLRSDATAPLTTFAPSGTFFTGAGGASFAPPSFSYGFSAADPVSGDVASGVAFTRFRTDTAAPGIFDVFASTFGLAEGVRRIEFQSQDNVGNMELLKSATVFIDATAPETALTVGAPRFAAGADLYVSSSTLFSLASQDPVVQAVASGVSSITVRIGAGAFGAYDAPFTLPATDGTQTFGWRAADNVGNLEGTRASAVLVDGTAPLTALVVAGGRQFPASGGFYASADTRLSFTASDPMVNGAASGVAFTHWQDGGGAFQAYASPFGLVEGAHALGYRSEDNVANREVLRSTAVLVDATAPVSSVAVGSPNVTAADGSVHATPATPFVFSAADQALPTGQPGSGVERVEVSVDGAPFAAAAGPLSFSEGRHDVLYRAIDNVGNLEVTRALFIQSDATPPLTSLSISTPMSGGYVSGDTRFVLAAVDPVVNGAASGVKLSRYRVNGGAFVTEPLDFGLSGADGAYTLEYQSEDNIGNLEVLRSTAVILDRTPPATTILVGSPSFTAQDGTLYVDPAAPVTLTAVDSASGVERIEVSVDGAPFTAYIAALTFAEGRHSVQYRAVDKVENIETVRMLNLRSDATPPLTTFTPSGTLFTGAGGASFAPLGFFYALPAADPVVNDVASGLAFTRYSLNSGAFSAYTTTFTLAEGVRRVDFQSGDNLGHLELIRSATVFVDAAAPLTVLEIGVPQFTSSGTVYVSAGTPLSLASQDPVVQEVASGLSSVAFQIGAGAFAPYASPFTLQAPDGARAINWHALDNVGNQEGAKTSTVLLDATEPLTSLLVVGGRQFPGPDASGFYASSDTRLVLVASDPLVNGSASGVALTRWQENGGGLQAYSGALSLAEGAHALQYQSQDNVSNLEVVRSTTAFVDATPPVTSVLAGSPSFTAADGSVHVATATPVSFTAADPTLPSGQAGSGVARVEISIDGGAFVGTSGPLTFGEGRHDVFYRALDNVGNVEAARALSIQSDATPPVATLSISTPVSGGFVSSATRFILAAVDPVVGGAASGVKLARYRVNGGTFVTAPLDFGLSGADGAYTVEYQSEDNIGNLEVARSTSVFLDQTPPVTTVMVGASSFTAVDGTLYVDPAAPVTLTAADAASGVEHIEVSVDGAPFTAYAAALTFTEGRHTVLYRAVDKVGNTETARILSLRSDATPPLTTFAPSGTLFAGAGGALFAPPIFSYALPGADPIVGDVASGLAFTRYSLDFGTFQTYAMTFALAEGVRRVDFQSADNLGHFELLRGATVFVDATAPLTALGIGAPQFSSSGTVYVSTATPFSLASQDPVTAGVASGVSVISFRLDAVAFGSYMSDFRIPGPDGPRSVSWFATDNVGNVEAMKNGSMALDATAPRSSLLVIGGRQAPGSDAAAFYASSDTRVAFTGEDSTMGGVASGLSQIRFQDNGGVFQSFTVPLALGEGRHALGYQGQDNVLNLEVLRSTTVFVDATPPVTAVSVGAPIFTAADGTIYVAPASPISFTAADPSLPSGEAGSGVERVEVSVDGSAFTAFTAPLTFSEGLHTVRYRALDRVGNVEAERTLQLRSDATPPASELVIGEPSFPLSSAVVLVGAATPLSVAAQDSTVNGVASGVRETFYRFVDVSTITAPFRVFTASFTFTGAEGGASVEFYSLDRVLNTEQVRSRALLLDSTRPEAAIDSPHGGHGICSVVKGMIPVRGTARDLHFATYLLESAPGRDAAAGFVLVSSGADAVNTGLLGIWDARGLSGWQTLRLTVMDQVRNASVATLSVFVGDPGRLLVLGNHEVFNMPQGVAAGTDGRIYVADTNDDQVKVFSATGTAFATFGRGHGHDEDKDAGLRLNKPKGVAVDAAGAIYVADTYSDRVLKLSATGQVLLEVGRRKPGKKDDDKDGKSKGENESSEFQSGKGPGEFRKPSGVAVDGAGNIFVADTDNNRVQKLGPDGSPLLAFSLPPALGDGEDRDRDCESPELGRPVGIALDGAGNIYVADPRGARALKFSPAGQLLMTLPIYSESAGGQSKPGRPEGIAVSPDGSCVLVSDRRSSRVIKFDAAGVQTLAFGERGKIWDNKPLPRQLALRKPAGLALDAEGKLYVADRNNGRIQVFGYPTGEPTVVVPPSVYDHDDDQIAREVVDREDGGLVVRDDRAGVSIPAGALAEDLKITVSTPAVAVESERNRNRDDQNLKVVSAPVEYGPEGTKFNEPVTLTLPYTPDLIAAQGVAEDSLKINYWNKEKGEWEALESQVDKKSGTVTAKTPHFSLYQVLGSTGVSAAIAPLAADASFGLKDMYAFPSPVRGQGPVTIRVQPGRADSLTVRVYDVSGRKIHESSNFADRGGFDDGNGKGQQFTYDHVWDVSGVGSGIYTFVVTAVKSGERDIHKTGKVGIIK